MEATLSCMYDLNLFPFKQSMAMNSGSKAIARVEGAHPTPITSYSSTKAKSMQWIPDTQFLPIVADPGSSQNSAIQASAVHVVSFVEVLVFIPTYT